MSATVLIVDDEPQLLRLLVRVFEREGFTVLSAETGDKAMDLFSAHAARIDALVLDVIIPPRGATEVLEAVVEQRAGVGVVLTSGDHPPEAITATLDQCGGRFLRKPFLPRALVDSVREVCARRSG